MTTAKMPSLFIGHGSPMNALEQNSWTEHLRVLGEKLPKPKAVICVSAHWLTPNVRRLHVKNPKTIHDFYGFPAELYKQQYAAPGYLLEKHDWSVSDESWGYDHGAWSVLKHLYPTAQIPVLMLSLCAKLTMQEHMKLGQHLKKLREDGFLILGSGNITHNLRDLDFAPKARPRDWAVEFDGRAEEAIVKRDWAWLFNQKSQYQKLWQTAHPTPEHYWPLLYVMGAAGEDEKVSFPFGEIQAGSLSMRSVLYQ